MRPRNGSTAGAVNARALEHGVIGGHELGVHYPELEGAMLVCATEMNRREDIDRFAQAW